MSRIFLLLALFFPFFWHLPLTIAYPILPITITPTIVVPPSPVPVIERPTPVYIASTPVKIVPTPVVPVPVVPQGSIVQMIRAVFGPYADRAIHIAQCESGLNPYAWNPVAIGNSHASGIFQILYPSTWYGTSFRNHDVYDASSNILAAHEIFVRDGYTWREWACH